MLYPHSLLVTPSQKASSYSSSYRVNGLWVGKCGLAIYGGQLSRNWPGLIQLNFLEQVKARTTIPRHYCVITIDFGSHSHTRQLKTFKKQAYLNVCNFDRGWTKLNIISIFINTDQTDICIYGIHPARPFHFIVISQRLVFTSFSNAHNSWFHSYNYLVMIIIQISNTHNMMVVVLLNFSKHTKSAPFHISICSHSTISVRFSVY